MQWYLLSQDIDYIYVLTFKNCFLLIEGLFSLRFAPPRPPIVVVAMVPPPRFVFEVVKSLSLLPLAR